ncbi:MAG: ferrous iron transport protein B [Acidobacteria bacterium]|nr:ferrous iron transport protein B [Acidobacteriota bacterium]
MNVLTAKEKLPAKSLSDRPLVVLAGNPNTGKTTVFNALCGTRQKVGNFPGVTVEKKSGSLELSKGSVELVDLPGLYSLNPLSPDEQVATEGIMGRVLGMREPNLTLFVLDATNIKRNLYLLSQVCDVNRPTLVVLTMTDLLEKEGIVLHRDQLEAAIGLPVVALDGRNTAEVKKLKVAIEAALENPPRPRVQVQLPNPVEQALEKVHAFNPALTRLEALQLLLGEQTLEAYPIAMVEAESQRRQLESELPFKSLDLAQIRYDWAQTVALQSEERILKGKTLSQKIDRLLLHRFWGLIFFVAIMFVVFQSIYTWAVPFMDWIDAGFSWLSDRASLALADTPLLQSVVVDGMIAGVGSVIIFLPQIIILFLFVAFLEDSGYLARAAFLMDKLLGWTGLNGRAFIPMLSSFACAVPGIMAARVMPDPKARMATILVSPLMSCSARLPIYILIISAFIEPHYGPIWAAVALFGMHALGLFLALPIAFLLNRKVLKTPEMPFILEMPPYRMPKAFNVFFRAFEAGKKFTLRAGTVIFAFSILIWALSYFPRPASVAESVRQQAAAQATPIEEADLEQMVAGAYLEQSYLGRMGKTIQPVFAPLGFDWKITVGILGAFPAREVILSTLGIIYQIGETDETDQNLKTRMAQETWPDGRPVFTPLVAVVLMIFFALCSQCMSTLITVQKELNSWKWAGFLFSYMTALAYVVSLFVYQGGRLLGWG